MRGLVIREPWIGLILSGRKTWEVRGQRVKMRGRIALIRSGSGMIVGQARVLEVIGPLTAAALGRQIRRHAVPQAELRRFVKKYNGRAFAWVLGEIKRFKHPLPYKHPRGAISWVRLPDDALKNAR